MYESVGLDAFVTASAKQYEDVEGLRKHEAVYRGL
jgi:hypothetical protein